MNEMLSNPSLPYGLLSAFFVIVGFLFIRKWIASGQSAHGIVGIALIFGSIYIASLAPTGVTA